MLAVVVRGPGEYGVEEVPEPVYGDYEALVRISHCGICTGTDRHIIAGKEHFPYLAPYPTVLGHESVGDVVAVGSSVRYLKEGDVVLRAMTGALPGYSSTFGGMAEYGVVGDARAIAEDAPCSPVRLPRPMAYQQKVPPDFDRAGAGVFITFKETLSAAQDFGVQAGSRVLILGVGGVGQCFVRACKLLGAEEVIAVGRRSAPLERAAEMGADQCINSAGTNIASAVREAIGGGCTHVIDAVGSNDLLQQGLELLAPGGQLGQYGVPPARQITLDWSAAPAGVSMEILAPQEHRVHKLCLDWVRLRFFDPRSLLDAVLPLGEVHKAFELIEDQQAMRVTLTLT